MSTLAELAYMLNRRLEGGNIPRDAKWTSVELIEAIGHARDARINDWLTEQRAEARRRGEDFSVPHQLVSVFRNVEVFDDDGIDMKYIKLPAPFASLPGGAGVQHISTMLDQENNFKYLPQGGGGLFSYGAASRLEGRVGFWYEPGPGSEDRIYFKFLPYNIEKVLLKMVAKAGGIDPNDPLPMHSWMVKGVLDDVFNQYATAGQIPDDKSNDTQDE